MGGARPGGKRAEEKKESWQWLTGAANSMTGETGINVEQAGFSTWP